MPNIYQDGEIVMLKAQADMRQKTVTIRYGRRWKGTDLIPITWDATLPINHAGAILGLTWLLKITDQDGYIHGKWVDLPEVKEE